MWGIKSASTNMDVRYASSNLEDTLFWWLTICSDSRERVADVYHLLNETETVELPYLGDFSIFEVTMAVIDNMEYPGEAYDDFVRDIAKEWAELIIEDYGSEEPYSIGEDEILVTY